MSTLQSPECSGSASSPSDTGPHPDWRWHRALAIVAGSIKPGWFEDWRVRMAVKYQRALAADKAESTATAALGWPELSVAHELYCQGGPRRDEIEARLLAGEHPEIIADKTGMATAVIRIFESVFFDVRHRLDDIDWIMDTAVGRCHWSERSPTQRETWCYAAVVFGARAVDCLVAQSLNRPVAWDAVTAMLAGTAEIMLLTYAHSLRVRPGSCDPQAALLVAAEPSAQDCRGDAMLLSHVQYLRCAAGLPLPSWFGRLKGRIAGPIPDAIPRMRVAVTATDDQSNIGVHNAHCFPPPQLV